MRKFFVVVCNYILSVTNRTFVAREVILRSNDKVTYFRLSPLLQKSVAGTMAGLVIWLLVSNVGWGLSAADSRSVRQSLMATQQSYAMLERKTQSDYAEMTALARQMHETESSLAALLSDAQGNPALPQADIAFIEGDRGALRAQLDSLKSRFDRDRAAVGLLQNKIAGLQDKLTGSEQQRVVLAQQVNDVNAQMTTLRRSQDALAAQLADRTRANINDFETTLAMTGLDVDNLLRRAEKTQSGRGGPFIPAVASGGQALLQEAAWPGVSDLDAEISRWENMQILLRNVPLSAPVDRYTINSTFGSRKDPLNGHSAFHEGLDLANAIGTPIMATAPGKVVFAGWSGNYGRMIEIDHGFGIRTRYGHLSAINVKLGDKVIFRQKIGELGNSGRSTGPHVHYEIIVDGKPQDPMKFMEAGRYVFKG